MSEADFPTILDLRDRLSDLIAEGFGAFPVQILIVPDSTIQAVARFMGQGPDDKPALMIELTSEGQRIPVGLISTDRFPGGNGGMKTREPQ